jgi:hypothetical protein
VDRVRSSVELTHKDMVSIRCLGVAISTRRMNRAGRDFHVAPYRAVARRGDPIESSDGESGAVRTTLALAK